MRQAPPAVEPETREPVGSEPAVRRRRAAPRCPAEPGETFPRNKFLEGATLGLGAVIGGVITLPVLGFAVAPRVPRSRAIPTSTSGRSSNFPEGQFVVATFMDDPAAGRGRRRTAYVRNNGAVERQPSFTILSNRCAHLGCPVQPNGLLFNDQEKTVKTDGRRRPLIPSLPAGLRLPLPRRPVRHRGQPHGRARRSERSTATSS